jgi:hypothetical protein
MKPFAWSYSVVTRYENCPKQYYHLNVIKDFKDSDSEYAAEGKLVHDSMKHRVIFDKPLPMPLRHLEPIAKKFADKEGEKHGEMRLALNRDFEPVDFFAPDVWVRAIVDLMIVNGNTAIIIDWKTGKVKNDFTQLGLSAAVASRWMPEIELFKTAFIWTKSKQASPKNYTLTKLQEVWNDLIPRAEKIESARATTSFPACPSGLCRYCPVASCPHYEPR